jgi:hypothetical protein
VGRLQSIKIDVFTILCFVGAWIFVTLVIFPLQSRFLMFADVASLLFLPHGVRILATWLTGARAIVPLTLAEALAASIIWGWDGLQSQWTILAASVVGGSSAFITFRLFLLAGISCTAKDHGMRLWRVLLLVALGASIINSLGKAIVLGEVFNPMDTTKVIATFIIGDVLGAASCLMLMLFAFRHLQRP